MPSSNPDPDDRGKTPPSQPAASANPTSEKDRALAALHQFAKPQPKANPENPLEVDYPGPASGPSGFVSMLAKGQLGSGDSHAPSHTTGNPSSKSRYPLQMAREIHSPPVPGGAKEQAAAVAAPRRQGAKSAAKPPSSSRGYRVVLPVLVLTALTLLLIGLWAAGALVYMASVTPTEPSEARYPLIHWSFDEGDAGGYTRTSRLMALSMLPALPIALVLGIAALVMARRLARRNPAKAA